MTTTTTSPATVPAAQTCSGYVHPALARPVTARRADYTRDNRYRELINKGVHLSETELDTDNEDEYVPSDNDKEDEYVPSDNDNEDEYVSSDNDNEGFSNPFYAGPVDALAGHLPAPAAPVADPTEPYNPFANNPYETPRLLFPRKAPPTPAEEREYSRVVSSPSKFMERLVLGASTPKVPTVLPPPSPSRPEYIPRRRHFKEDSTANPFLSPAKAESSPFGTGSHLMSPLTRGTHTIVPFPPSSPPARKRKLSSSLSPTESSSFHASDSPLLPRFIPYQWRHAPQPRPESDVDAQGETDNDESESELLARSRSAAVIQRSRTSSGGSLQAPPQGESDSEEFYGGSDKENAPPPAMQHSDVDYVDFGYYSFCTDSDEEMAPSNAYEASNCPCEGDTHSQFCPLFVDPSYDCPCHYEHREEHGEYCPLNSDPPSAHTTPSKDGAEALSPDSTPCKSTDDGYEAGDDESEESGNENGDPEAPENDEPAEARFMLGSSSRFMTGRRTHKSTGHKMRGGFLEQVELCRSRL